MALAGPPSTCSQHWCSHRWRLYVCGSGFFLQSTLPVVRASPLLTFASSYPFSCPLPLPLPLCIIHDCNHAPQHPLLPTLAFRLDWLGVVVWAWTYRCWSRLERTWQRNQRPCPTSRSRTAAIVIRDEPSRPIKWTLYVLCARDPTPRLGLGHNLVGTPVWNNMPSVIAFARCCSSAPLVWQCGVD